MYIILISQPRELARITHEIAVSWVARGFAPGPHWGAYSAPQIAGLISPPPEIPGSATGSPPSNNRNLE